MMIVSILVCLLAVATSTLALPPGSRQLNQRQNAADPTSAPQASPISSTYISLGCILDDSSRVMNTTWTNVGSVDDCARIAKSAGRRYFGIENGKACFVADTLSKTIPSTGCDTPCSSGAGSGQCGGSWRLNLYEFSSTPTTNPASHIISRSSPPASSEYTYQGCIADTTSRAMNQTWTTSSTMTTVKCADIAKAAGKRYFGLQNGNQCFISDTLAFLRTSTGCTKECAGDRTSVCGGSWAISLYSRTDQSSTRTTAASMTRTTSSPSTSSSATSSFSQYSTCPPATTTPVTTPTSTATVCYDYLCPPRQNATVRPAVEAIFVERINIVSCR